MTLALTILISTCVFAFFTNVAFFGAVVYIFKIMTHIFAYVFSGVIVIAFLKLIANLKAKKVVVHGQTNQSPPK